MCHSLLTRSASVGTTRGPRSRIGLVSVAAARGIIVFCLLSLPSSASAETTEAAPPDAWPVARGTASGCGVAGGTLPDQPALLWTFTDEKQGFQAGAVIDGGSVYVGFRPAAALYAVDLATGKKRWEYAGKSSYKTAPAVRDGRVFIGDQDGEFACFDAKTGRLLWKYATDGPIDSAANFYRDCVLFGSEDANEYCLEAAGGKLVWKFDMEDQVRCLATIAGNRGYFATCGATLYTIDLDKGDALSKVPIDSPTGCAAALGKDRVFVGNEDNQFLAVDLVKGAIAWRFQDRAGRCPIAPRRPSRPTASMSDRATRSCMPLTRRRAASSGNSRRGAWSTVRRSSSASRVFFGSQDGRIYGLDRHSGKEVWRYDAGGKIFASPAVAGGRLVIGSDSGHLYCFGEVVKEVVKQETVCAPALPVEVEAPAEVRPSSTFRYVELVLPIVAILVAIFVLSRNLWS